MRIQGIAASETPIPLLGRDDVLAVDGGLFPSSLPLRESHKPGTYVGATHGFTRCETCWTFEGFVVGEDYRYRVRSNQCSYLSIGYEIERAEIINPGYEFVFSGRTYRASQWRATRLITAWRPFEISLTNRPADARCSINRVY